MMRKRITRCKFALRVLKTCPQGPDCCYNVYAVRGEP
jgi:hypothetical protein